MTIRELNVFWPYFFYGLIFLLSIFSLSLALRSRLILKTRSYEYGAYGVFLLAFFLLQILTELLNADRRLYFFIKDIKVFVFVGLVIFIVFFDLFLWVRLRAVSKWSFTDLSIKECMDTLPVGLAFSDRQGRPYLVNYKVDEVSRMIFGRNLLNTLDFFDRAMEARFLENVRVLSRADKLVFILCGQVVWQIKNVDHGDFLETIVSDLSEEYRLVNEIKENNKKSQALNNKLKAYRENLDSFIRDKELLAAKRKIHDDFSRSLILFRIYMEDGEKTWEKRRQLLSLWKQNLVLLKGGMTKESRDSSWEKLVKAAASAGLNIQLSGDLPRQGKILQLLIDILHEAINNAIVHGQAKTLFLQIVESDNSFRFFISNDGLRPAGPIVEKGGLKNIRRLVELEAGSFSISQDPDFVMEIVLGKEADEDETQSYGS
ncbi:MAG: hypothetical protein Q4E36_00260 [Bacillota bacterium]|nr:hypothetical protein [Bacillota bacterium]